MATVYDKSSLFLAPSGVSNGTVFVQKPVPIYGSEQVTNGDFSQTGAELITNGDFATDSDWEKSSFWTISGGAASMPSTPSYLPLYQNDVTIAGKTYVLNFDIVSIIGTIKATSINNGAAAGEITLGEYSTTGNKKVYFTAGSGREAIAFARVVGNTSSCTIDNVSVKEVGQDWTLGTGWSIGEDKAILTNGTDSTYQVFQAINGLNTKRLKVTFDISNFSGSAEIRYPLRHAITANGSYSYEGIGDFDRLQFQAKSGATTSFDITNISVQEVLSPDGDFTFTRGSNLSATRVNEAQLIEKGRENLLTYSNQFDTSWSTSSAIPISGYADRNSGTNAWLLREFASSSPHWIRQSSGLYSGIGTFSFYAKKKDYDWIQFGRSGDGGDYANFNISNGTLGNVSGASIIDRKIESAGNGWYRCSVTYSFFSNSFVGIALIRSDVSTRYEAYLGDGTSGTYIQDAQVEQGLAATSVITTGAGTVQAGLLENTPRLDYSGGATCPSLLLEPQRTNILLQSEYLGGEFSLDNVSLDYNYGTSPEGVSNSALLTQIGSNPSNSMYKFNLPTTDGSYTYSFFFKAGTSTTVRMYVATGIAEDFNPQTTTAGYSGGAVNILFEDYGDGWWRASATKTLSGASTNRFSIYPDRENQGRNVEIWGAQVETGSYATSYIPTYGTSQTRAVDNTATLDLSPFGLNGEDVTHFIEFKNNQAIVRDSGGTSFRFNSNSANFGGLRIYRSNSNSKPLTVVFQDTNGDFVPNGYEMTSLNPKVAIKRVWSTGEIKVFVDGNKVIDTASTLYNSWNLVNMEGTGSTVEVKQLVSFPTALSDLDCEILTGATTYGTFDEMALALNYTVYE